MLRLFLIFACFARPLFAAAPNYLDDVLPIFKKHCLSCHNPDKKKADLDLSSYQAALIGSSGGEVIKPGVPDSSVLYMVMDHHEDFDPMPPKKPKLAAADLKVVHGWIAGGILESADGKSSLRDVSFNLAAGNAGRPENPAMPVGLAAAATRTGTAAPPVVALAASPWADLLASSGHEAINFFGPQPPPLADPDCELVAKDDLLLHYTFDEHPRTTDGMIGKALFEAQGLDLVATEIPSNFFPSGGTFTFAAWVKPEAVGKYVDLIGNPVFAIYLEPTRNGWRVRTYNRSENNGILACGRKSEILSGTWQHIAVSCNNREWVVWYNGVEVSRDVIKPELKGWLDSPRAVHIGTDTHNKDRMFRGALDDLRFYRRALSGDEVAQVTRNGQSRFGSIGSVPFPEGSIHDLRFSPNGELLVAAGGVGAASGKVLVYDVKTGALQASLGNEQDSILSADITPDHAVVAIGTPSKMVKLLSTKDGTLLHRIEKHTDWVTVVRFSPDGKWLASGDRNGGIHVWETDTGGIVYTLDEHKVKVTSLSWRADGKMLASGAEDGKFVLWDMKDGWPTRTATAHEEPSATRYSRRTGILDLNFSRDGRIITVGRDRKAKWWATDGQAIAGIDSLPSLPTRGTLNYTGEHAYIGDITGTLHILSIPEKRVIQSVRQP